MRDFDDCVENASLRAAWLCETFVSVSRRPALKETCLRRVMERVVEDCARTVAGSIPGGGVDAPGARRVAAFHRALCSAAETRDASDAKKKGNDDSETALRWVERAFARPVAVATATAVASGGGHRSRRRAPGEPRRETRRVVSDAGRRRRWRRRVGVRFARRR